MFTPYNVMFTLCSVMFTPYNVMFTLCSVIFTPYDVMFTLCSVMFTFCSMRLHSLMFAWIELKRPAAFINARLDFNSKHSIPYTFLDILPVTNNKIKTFFTNGIVFIDIFSQIQSGKISHQGQWWITLTGFTPPNHPTRNIIGHVFRPFSLMFAPRNIHTRYLPPCNAIFRTSCVMFKP